MQDHPDQAALRETGRASTGLAALLDPTLSPLFEPPQPSVLDPAWAMHLPFLAWVLVAARPSLLVTLGRRAASAHLACCDTVTRFALPTRCRAVVEPDPDGGPAVDPELLRRHAARHAAFSQIIASPSIHDPTGIADASIDLLLLDAGQVANQTGAAPADRWARWAPKLSPRAVLVVHDLSGTRSGPDVWLSLRPSSPVFTLHGGAGLAVAAMGSAIPPGLAWLLSQAAHGDELSRLQDRVAAFGERWRIEQLLRDEQDAGMHRQAVDRAALLLAQDALHILTVAHDRLRDELAFSKADRFRWERQAGSLEARLQQQDQRHRQERFLTESLAAGRADSLEANLVRQFDQMQTALRHGAEVNAADRTAEREAAERARADASATAGALRVALAEAESAIRVLRNSLSWRLTQPIRTLRGLLGGSLRPARPGRQPIDPPALPHPFAAPPLASPPVDAAPPPPEPAALPRPAPLGAEQFAPSPAPVEPGAPDPQPATLGPGGWRPIRRILFVAGEPGTPGAAYRTARNAAACRAAGVEAECVDIAGVDPHNLAAADLVVLWRAGFSAHVQTMLALAAHARTRVVFDVDDLIVQPALAVAEIIDGIRTTFVTEAESRAYFQSMQRTMLNCDLCTTTTRELAAAMGQQHPMVRVLPNSFDETVERASRRAVRLRGERAADGLVRLGYAGGTRTHQKDFATIVTALVAVLGQRDQVRLVLFRDGRSGEGLVLLDEFPALLPFAHRIEWRDLVPLAELPAELARFDVSLCPLEPGNPFCEAKSELKYFESALAGVCVVATPTGPFRRAVRHGVTGFLPDDARGWTDTLLQLVDDPALRRRTADAANNDVLWRFGPRRQAELWALLLRELDGGADGARAAELSLRRGDDMPADLPEVPDGVLLFSHDALGEALVTVGMTSFNYERHLMEALDSVSAQTLEHLDLVVVDDGSGDGSVALLLDWAERNRMRFNRLRILRTETNAGLGGARNLVFAQAETPWIMVLDSDNHLAPSACETLLAAVQADAMAAFAYPRIRQFGGAALVTGADDFQPTRLAAGNYIDAMALVAKWAWSAAGGYYVQRGAMGWEDFSLWCRLVELGLHGVPVAQELAFYRVHDASMVNAITEQSDNKRLMVSFVEARHPWLRLRMRAPRKRLDQRAAQ